MMYARIPLWKNELIKIRTRTMRKGVWFKVLTRAERAQIELTIKIVEKIRSSILAKVVTSIVKKLLHAMESKVARSISEVGQVLVQKLSGIAQNWGNKSAHQWIADQGFIQYLTINHINTPTSFRM